MANNIISVEQRGMKEILTAMQHFPKELKKVSQIGMNASMLVLWENVPSYPSQPEGSTYDRTGTLGRTLGSSESGGKGGGKPDVYTVKSLGAMSGYEGNFGTNLNYAEYVIGEGQAKQNAHWWHLTDIIPKAEPKITKIWEGIMQKLAAFLNAKSK